MNRRSAYLCLLLAALLCAAALAAGCTDGNGGDATEAPTAAGPETCILTETDDKGETQIVTDPDGDPVTVTVVPPEDTAAPTVSGTEKPSPVITLPKDYFRK